MARSKSITGAKTSRAKGNDNSKEQIASGNPVQASEVTAVAEPASTAISPEVKVTPETKAPAEPKASSDGRKFEVMKTDSRKNLVPINLEDEIRRRAYELYQLRGPGSGSEADDWFAAEREVRQRYRQQSA